MQNEPGDKVDNENSPNNVADQNQVKQNYLALITQYFDGIEPEVNQGE